MKSIWEAASKTIKDSDELVFIGYTLPLADHQFRGHLMNNMREDAVIKIVLAGVDKPIDFSNPDKSSAIYRYRNLFGNRDITEYYCGFSSFITSFLHERQIPARNSFA